MHIHYDYTVFDMINCQEYIIAVLLKLFLNLQRWQQETKRLYDYFPIRGYFIKILICLDEWKKSKNYKGKLFAYSESNIPEKSQHLYSWYGAHYIIIKDWNTLDHAARW